MSEIKGVNCTQCGGALNKSGQCMYCGNQFELAQKPETPEGMTLREQALLTENNLPIDGSVRLHNIASTTPFKAASGKTYVSAFPKNRPWVVTEQFGGDTIPWFVSVLVEE